MNIVTKAFNTTGNIATSAKDKIQSDINDFGSFLMSNNIPQIAIAFMISTQISRVSNDFIDNIISPIINKIIGQEATTLQEKYIEIFGIKFQVGNFFASILKFILFLIILYYILKLIGIDKLKKN